MKQEMLSKYDCDAIVLFGSYSRGTQTPESDIDIAFKTSEETSKKDIFYLKQKLEDIASKDIDLINLDNIGDSFRYESIERCINRINEEYQEDVNNLNNYITEDTLRKMKGMKRVVLQQLF